MLTISLYQHNLNIQKLSERLNTLETNVLNSKFDLIGVYYKTRLSSERNKKILAKPATYENEDEDYNNNNNIVYDGIWDYYEQKRIDDMERRIDEAEFRMNEAEEKARQAQKQLDDMEMDKLMGKKSYTRY